MLMDLQLHSTYSDGYLTPTQLAKFLQKRGVKTASLTDHNTVAGQDEFHRACQKRGIKMIPGLEVYTKLEHRKFNIVWCNFCDHRDLHDLLRNSQIRRRNNVRKILRRLDFDLDIERTLDKYTKYIPINQIIDDILEVDKNRRRVQQDLDKEHIRLQDMIDNYFRNKDIGILNESYIDIERIFRLRKKLGGEIILNHPGKYGTEMKESFVSELKDMGLDGIEKMSPHHSYSDITYIQYLARKYDLIETGGSDFHCHAPGNYPVRNAWDYFHIDDDHLRKVKKVINK